MTDDDYSEDSLSGGSLTTAMRCCSAVTIFACLIVVWIYLTQESIRQKNLNKVVFYICVCQIGTGVGTILGQPRNGTAECYAQAALTNYFPFAYTFWTTVTAYMLYRVTHRLTPFDISSKIVQGVCWGLPLLLTVFPLTTDTFGNEDARWGWCFYKSVKSSPEWTVTFWVAVNYSFLCLSVFLSVGFILSSLFAVYGLSQSVTDAEAMKKLSKNVSRFIWYPLISFICWLPESIYDLNDSLDKGQSVAMRDDATFKYFAFLPPILEGVFITIAYFATSQDARTILLSAVQCTGEIEAEGAQSPQQFKYSSDPEDYDESRDTISLEKTLAASKSASPFHFQTGRNVSTDGVELKQY